MTVLTNMDWEKTLDEMIGATIVEAKALIRVDDFIGAKKILMRAIESINTKNPVILQLLALVYASENNFEEAAKYADLCGKHGDWMDQYASAHLFLDINDQAQAVYWFMKAAENGDADAIEALKCIVWDKLVS